MKENNIYDEALKLENQLCFPLYACARTIVNQYTPFLKPLGITYTQYLVFLALWEKDELTVGELCQTLYLDSGTLTPLLKKMEEKGYVTRTRKKEDERVVVIKLTKQGKDFKKQAQDIPFKVGACINLNAKDGQQLHKLLHTLLANMN